MQWKRFTVHPNFSWNAPVVAIRMHSESTSTFTQNACQNVLIISCGFMPICIHNTMQPPPRTHNQHLEGSVLQYHERMHRESSSACTWNLFRNAFSYTFWLHSECMMTWIPNAFQHGFWLHSDTHPGCTLACLLTAFWHELCALWHVSRLNSNMDP